MVLLTGRRILMFSIVSLMVQGPLMANYSNFSASAESFNCTSDTTIRYLAELHKEYMEAVNSFGREIATVGSVYQKIHAQLTSASHLSSSFCIKLELLRTVKQK
jgi:predicted trehalose synthase